MLKLQELNIDISTLALLFIEKNKDDTIPASGVKPNIEILNTPCLYFSNQETENILNYGDDITEFIEYLDETASKLLFKPNKPIFAGFDSNKNADPSIIRLVTGQQSPTIAGFLISNVTTELDEASDSLSKIFTAYSRVAGPRFIAMQSDFPDEYALTEGIRNYKTLNFNFYMKNPDGKYAWLERMEVSKKEYLASRLEDNLISFKDAGEAMTEERFKTWVNEFIALPDGKKLLQRLVSKYPFILPDATPWTHETTGKQYLKTSANLVYDINTQVLIGVWNNTTNNIDPLPEGSNAVDEPKKQPSFDKAIFKLIEQRKISIGDLIDEIHNTIRETSFFYSINIKNKFVEGLEITDIKVENMGELALNQLIQELNV
ncbi:MAG: hypothetical protein WD512_07400, partial [Candidatus Paceibacterota bacterium]